MGIKQAFDVQVVPIERAQAIVSGRNEATEADLAVWRRLGAGGGSGGQDDAP